MTKVQELRNQRLRKKKHDIYRFWELYCKTMETPATVAWLKDKFGISRSWAYQLVNEFLEHGEPPRP